MALNKCASIVGANITDDCTAPIVAGLQEVGIGYHLEDVTFTRDAGNPRLITAVTVAATKKGFAVYNQDQIPFADSLVEMNTETARPTYNKTLNLKVPMIGGENSKDVVEPLTKGRNGFVFIIPTKNKVADGGFVIIGSEAGAICTASTRNLTDPNLGMAAAVTMVETAANFETVTLSGATFAAAQTTFDTLLAAVY